MSLVCRCPRLSTSSQIQLPHDLRVKTFKHILGCVDPASDKAEDTELNDTIFELSQSISNDHDASFSILHTWFLDDEALLSARFKPDHVASYERDERQHHEEKLHKFLEPM